MIEYVLIYAESIENENNFILVEKQKPDWQKGFYNLVGGLNRFDKY